MIEYARLGGGWWVVVNGNPHWLAGIGPSGPYIMKMSARIRVFFLRVFNMLEY